MGVGIVVVVVVVVQLLPYYWAFPCPSSSPRPFLTILLLLLLLLLLLPPSHSVTKGQLTDEYRVGFRQKVSSTEDAKSEIIKMFQEAWERENG